MAIQETVSNWLFSLAGTLSDKVPVSQHTIYLAILAVSALILGTFIRTEKDIRYWLICGAIFYLFYKFFGGAV